MPNICKTVKIYVHSTLSCSQNNVYIGQLHYDFCVCFVKLHGVYLSLEMSLRLGHEITKLSGSFETFIFEIKHDRSMYYK